MSTHWRWKTLPLNRWAEPLGRGEAATWHKYTIFVRWSTISRIAVFSWEGGSSKMKSIDTMTQGQGGVGKGWRKLKPFHIWGFWSGCRGHRTRCNLLPKCTGPATRNSSTPGPESSIDQRELPENHHGRFIGLAAWVRHWVRRNAPSDTEFRQRGRRSRQFGHWYCLGLGISELQKDPWAAGNVWEEAGHGQRNPRSN